MDKLGIAVSLTSGYYPQVNGQVERANEEIGTFLHLFCTDNQEWGHVSYCGLNMRKTPCATLLHI